MDAHDPGSHSSLRSRVRDRCGGCRVRARFLGRGAQVSGSFGRDPSCRLNGGAFRRDLAGGLLGGSARSRAASARARWE